jgi:hypothetical protein
VNNSISKDINKYVNKYIIENRVKDLVKDLNENLYEDLDKADKNRIYFWYSSRKCRCKRFFNKNIVSQCL